MLLVETDRRSFLTKFRRPKLENIQRQAYAKAVNEKCKKASICPYCTAINGVVKKAGPLKIIHEPYRQKKFAAQHEEFKLTFAQAADVLPDLKNYVSRAADDMNPLKVLHLLKNITTEDCELLGLQPEWGRPEEYLWQYVPVPPVCIRPSVAQEGATNEDDLTVKLTEIVWINSIIAGNLQKGVAVQNLMEQWEFLQYCVAIYINSEIPGTPMTMGQKPMRGIGQRLKGKQGRFRGNLSGKRVDFSGRTVISPDPNLDIDEVAVPELVAKNLTYPERVFAHNIDRLRECVRRGPDVHPGANYVQGRDGFKKYLKYGDRNVAADRLQIGDVVERHLADRDIVLFNRQPSLHKLSIMSHFVKVRPWRTFRLNECVCPPYNSDFDGDEMNLHVPQTEEARTEARQLMGVRYNLVTPRNGEPIIAAIQDFISASFMLSRKDLFYDRKTFANICAFMGDACEQIDLPPPTIHKPVRLWTGKQIFNVLMRPNRCSKVLVNLEAKCRSFKKTTGAADFCPNDGYLIIRNSEVMCGVMDKSTIGEGKKNSLFYVILRDYGPDQAAAAMNRLAKLCARWIGNEGFSIGISDVSPGENLSRSKDAMVEAAYRACDDILEDSKRDDFELQSGCDKDQTVEAKMSGILSNVRGGVGDKCMEELSKYNAPLMMADCGSKGSKINVCQMVACVGQQIISGSRVPDGFQDRSLPHFPKGSKNPPSKGFVRNSFYSGLLPTEFLFHAISGREGLVDTAVKTAETGYMQRRLMKALEDLSTHYDTSVRNSANGVVQFIYGADGLDPTYMEGDGVPVALERSWNHVQSLKQFRVGRQLYPLEIIRIAYETVNTERWQAHVQRDVVEEEEEEREEEKRDFVSALSNFVDKNLARRLHNLRERYGLIGGYDATGEEYRGADLDAGFPPTQVQIIKNICSVTEAQLREFLELCLDKYMKAKVEPGTAVGAVGAQSIGEPGTQMTLKTFHFAGVASMNVTLGVPRIKEIINAAKTISTPIIKVKLATENSDVSARFAKMRIEKTVLSDIAESISEVVKHDRLYLEIVLDEKAISDLAIETDVYLVQSAIAAAPKLKIDIEDIIVNPREWKLQVAVTTTKKNPTVQLAMQALRRALPNVVIKGVPTVSRAVINIKDEVNDEGERLHELLVEGYGLREVMGTTGVVGTQTTSNHVIEAQKVLGIEAARQTIMNEIKYTMEKHGMNIDPRHVMLLGDIMTYKGEVLGITRFGVAKMKDSVLMLASFEKTMDHLFDASLYGKQDSIDGVSECIIMGVPAPLGTGSFQLTLPDCSGKRLRTRTPLFDPDENDLAVGR